MEWMNENLIEQFSIHAYMDRRLEKKRANPLEILIKNISESVQSMLLLQNFIKINS